MATKLYDIIARRINQHGPMDLGEYMSLCLGHKEYGYYMSRDPFGKDGDFTTAPEISQMFGEMIGAWLADTWKAMGSPSSFVLLECGPGRGTLMEDALRATRKVPGFHDAMKLYLMEMSPKLREMQGRKLAQYAPAWIDDLGGLWADMPILVIGNELLDALPIRQVRYQNEWVETVIGLGENETLSVGVKPASQTLLDHVPESILALKSPEIFEVSPILNQFIRTLSIMLKKQKGAALFIDYGHAVTAVGETLQAVRAHRFENPFENPGQSDITAHVDFDNIGRIAREEKIFASKVVTQGDFLKTLGIEIRAENLKLNATAEQKKQVETGVERLIARDQMGSLFKVITLYENEKLEPAGFV